MCCTIVVSGAADRTPGTTGFLTGSGRMFGKYLADTLVRFVQMVFEACPGQFAFLRGNRRQNFFVLDRGFADGRAALNHQGLAEQRDRTVLGIDHF